MEIRNVCGKWKWKNMQMARENYTQRQTADEKHCLAKAPGA